MRKSRPSSSDGPPVKPDRQLRWQHAAVRDLEETHAYLAERNPEAARRFAAAILEAAEQLLEFPEIGPIAEDLNPPGVIGACSGAVTA